MSDIKMKNRNDVSDKAKEAFIEQFEEEEDLKNASDEEKATFVRYVDELAVKDNELALRLRLYGKYSGNAVYHQDFYASRDDAERLFELTRDPYIANTLGYIYYYGRCNNGQPEYEKAFRYFAYGAANGLYESIYKLSDMYRNGYGVWESEKTAFTLISMLYQNIRPKYERDAEDDSSFADIALRMGSMILHGIGTEQDPDAAMSFLLEADYAIRRRMENHFYGDNVVAANIRKALAEAKQLVQVEENTGRYPAEFFAPVQMLMRDGYRITWTAKRLKDGDWSVTFKRAPKQDETKPAKTFLTMTAIAYCELTDTVKGHVISAFGLMQPEGRADAIEFAKDENGDTYTIFYYDQRPVLRLVGTIFDWIIKKPAKKSGKTVRIVSVTFSQSGREYDYLCDMDDIKAGDKVIVNGYNGPTEVEVQRVSIVPVEELVLPLDRYKKIEKRAGADESAETHEE